MSLLAKIASLRQVNINAHAEIEALKETLSYAAEMGLRPSSLIDEIKTLKKENKTLKDDDDRWEANCLYAEEWEDKYANCVLGMKKKNEIYADTGGDDDYRQAILDEIKALNDENKTLKLSLADRDEEVKSLKEDLDEPFARGASVEALKDEIKTLHAENKALEVFLADKIHTKMNDEVVVMCRKEINTLKVQLADGDRSTLSTHEHHRELRDKLNAEIETLKLYADRRRAEIKTLKDTLSACLTASARGMGVVFKRKKVAETEE